MTGKLNVSKSGFHSYIPSRGIFAKEHIARYAFASKFCKGMRVLDVACGTGYGSYFLLFKGAKEVIGGDLSQKSITQASHYKEQGLEFVILDATKLPFRDDSFEVIVSLETIEHISTVREFLQECSRCLVKGGIFVLSTPNKEVESPKTTKTSRFYHVREFSIGDISRLLNRYFADFARARASVGLYDL